MPGAWGLFKPTPPEQSMTTPAAQGCGESPGLRLWSSRARSRISAKWRAAVVLVILPAVKLISWNVNGLRAVLRKNFLEYLDAERPDVLCLQETRCEPIDIEPLWLATYTTFWSCAPKKGYAGTALFTNTSPLGVTRGIDIG